jgi:hypothetical protein
MFQKIEDFYCQEIRIDLIAAQQLASLNPKHIQYCSAAESGAFVVSVLQGDIQEGVYSVLMEHFFDTLAEAQQVYAILISENPGATHFDFVAHPTSGAAAFENPNTKSRLS